MYSWNASLDFNLLHWFYCSNLSLTMNGTDLFIDLKAFLISYKKKMQNPKYAHERFEIDLKLAPKFENEHKKWRFTLVVCKART
jgi:hypothetical protein